jgi:BirA family biotin operon repressor/biotin-[acetyl-CoA-carboxylase] ligase
VNADRALAASLSFHHDTDDRRPHSLVAGLAAVAAAPGTALKWPNDVLLGGSKVGGILVERSGDVTTIGLGLNLWWASPPVGSGALHGGDPGPTAHVELGALWGAELMERLGSAGWDRDGYREVCVTLGREISWEPDGSGTATDVTEDGELVVITDHGEEVIRSGAVRHVRD